MQTININKHCCPSGRPKLNWKKRSARTDEGENVQDLVSARKPLPAVPAARGLPVETQAARKTGNTGEGRGSKVVYRRQRSAVLGDDYPAHTSGIGVQGGRLRRRASKGARRRRPNARRAGRRSHCRRSHARSSATE